MKVDYDTIPDLMFLPAVLKRDIRKASMIPMGEREPGGPDIVLKSPLGFEDYVPRQKLVNIFRYNNGKKIKLGAWKKDDGNMVIAESNDIMHAMYIPPEYELVIPTEDGDRKLNSTGVYLVCADNGEGGIDRSSAFIISPKFFRKMFCMTGDILENAEQCEELQIKIRHRLEREQSLLDSNSEGEGEQDEYSSYKDEGEDEGEQDEGEQDEGEQYEGDSSNAQELKYEAIARIVQAEKNIGFLMVGLDGKEIRVTKTEILELARNKHINNVGIRLKDGKEFLYGIGIKLSELPEVD